LTAFAIRRIKQADANFVISSWVHNQRGSRVATLMGMSAWHGHYVPRVTRYVSEALQRDSSLRIDCLVVGDDDDAIIGWAATRGPVLDYVYIKAGGRRMGNASALLSAGSKPELRTHETPDSDRYFAKLGLPLDPYSFAEAIP
jgi:hypothetical protein